MQGIGFNVFHIESVLQLPEYSRQVAVAMRDKFLAKMTKTDARIIWHFLRKGERFEYQSLFCVDGKFVFADFYLPDKDIILYVESGWQSKANPKMPTEEQEKILEADGFTIIKLPYEMTKRSKLNEILHLKRSSSEYSRFCYYRDGIAMYVNQSKLDFMGYKSRVWGMQDDFMDTESTQEM